MTVLAFISLLFLLTAISGVINIKFLHLPMTIGMMVMGFIFSLSFLSCGPIFSTKSCYSFAHQFLLQFNFSPLLLDGILAFLLFAGSLHIDLNELWKVRYNVASLSILGTLLAIFFLGTVFWSLFLLFRIPISFLWCLVLGAIIAPTDPIAVLNMLGRLGLSKRLQTIFAGESLFNDGIALVAFSTLLSLALNRQPIGILMISLNFLQNIIGSCVIGTLTACMTLFIMKRYHDEEISILFSLALATGTFSLTNGLHMSGPIAVIISGLLFGNYLQKQKTEKNRQLIVFWNIIDELLNILLFLLMGLQVMIIPFNSHILIITLLAFPFLTLSRMIALSLSGSALLYQDSNPKGLLSILTWGGLRGGISLAIALSLPDMFPKKEILLSCYIFIVLTILIQGLSMERVVKHFYRQ